MDKKRPMKANFEIRIYDKLKKKTKVISLYSEKETLENLKQKILKNLEKT